MFKLPVGQDAMKRNSDWTKPDKWDEDIVETAGFVPLEVRFRKLQENGIRLQLQAQEFDSVDMRKLYLDDEFRIEPGDELEEIESKLKARQAYINELRTKQNVNLKNDAKDEAKNFKPDEDKSEDAEGV